MEAPTSTLFSPSSSLLFDEISALEHDWQEVAATASNIDADVPGSNLSVSLNDSILRHLETIGHLIAGVQ